MGSVRRLLKRKVTLVCKMVGLETYPCVVIGDHVSRIRTSLVEGVANATLVKPTTPWLLGLGFGKRTNDTNNVAAARQLSGQLLGIACVIFAAARVEYWRTWSCNEMSHDRIIQLFQFDVPLVSF